MSRRQEITVVVHGTFANVPAEPGEPEQPKWWRVSEHGLTAERLQNSIAGRDRDRAGTVWHPGADSRDGDMSYERLVEWSSANKHKDRVRAARQLTGSLRDVALGRGCTTEEPLHVNYVAHSHGGNVVLESLKYVQPSDIVRPRQVSLLGTPLTWRHTDPRLGYLSILFLFFFTWIGLEIAWFSDWGNNQNLADSLSLPEEIFWSIVFLTVLFWAAFGIIRVLRRISDGLPGRPAYGPAPPQLKEKTRGRPVVLFISDEDEADLMLQLGAAPLDTYRALVRGRPRLKGVGAFQLIVRLPLRAIETFFIRPFAYAIVVPLIEILLERFALGFPFRSVMVRNYEMTSWTKRDRYEQAIVKVPIEAAELERAQYEATHNKDGSAKSPATPGESTPATRRSVERQRIDDLRRTLLETLGSLKSQVHLSHSGYYQSQRILDDVASLIVAKDEDVSEVIERLIADQAVPPPVPLASAT